MPAAHKNKHWLLRKHDGRYKTYTPEQIAEEAIKYYKDVLDNPMYEPTLVHKDHTIVDVPKPRVISEKGFYLHLKIRKQTWLNYKSNDKAYKDYFDITTRICDQIYVYKFDGAATGLFQQSIISRDLGLVEKKEITKEKTKINIIVQDQETKDLLDKLKR